MITVILWIIAGLFWFWIGYTGKSLSDRTRTLERTYEVHKITIALLLAERKGSDSARAILNEMLLPSEEMFDTLLNGGK